MAKISKERRKSGELRKALEKDSTIKN